MTKKLPKLFRVPNPYKIPTRDQGNENSCTSHAFASCAEYYLSNKLKEKVSVDVDDLWQKQKKFGTATEEGDSMDGPIIIGRKYGVRFSAEKSGRRGRLFLSDESEIREGIVHFFVSKIEFD